MDHVHDQKSQFPFCSNNIIKTDARNRMPNLRVKFDDRLV